MRREKHNVLLDYLTPTIKRPGEYRRGELAKELLKGFALGGIVVTMFALPNSAQILTLFETSEPRERRRVRRALNGLRERGFLAYEHGAHGSFYRLTKKGEKRLNRIALEQISLPKEQVWDGQWRMVIFDIPNTKKHARNTLVGKLTELGCVQIQKSVYVYPHECRREILLLAEHLGVRKHIVYITATSIDNEQRYLTHFRLPK